MPSLKTLISTIALACLANAETIKIVAGSDNKFNPDTVKAANGDILEFHFEPKNHSVVAGDYQYPCSPMQLGTGFFSGFVPSESGEANKVFRVTVNGTDPVPVYSSQGNECASGMVAIINPTDTKNLTDYTKRASTLARSVTPGNTPFGGQLVDNTSSGSGGSSSSGNGNDGGKSGSGKDSGASGSITVSMASLLCAMGLAFLMA